MIWLGHSQFNARLSEEAKRPSHAPAIVTLRDDSGNGR